MTRGDFDVIIAGAGAAGLTALRELSCAGRRVLCLEARDRIGGRVHTIYDPLSAMPIELGAEFIHGRSPEIWDIVRSQQLVAYDCAQTAIHVKDGRVQHGKDGWELVDEVMQDMQSEAEHGKDRSFSAFLEQSAHSEDAKRLAASYVEGFNAARKEIVSIASLAKDAAAADEIDGDRSMRLVNGYGALMQHILAGVDQREAKLQLNSIVRRVEWSPGRAAVDVDSAIMGQTRRIQASRVVITVPLGVLQSGAEKCGDIVFDPPPSETLEAARALRFGQVMRVILRFREPFWEENEELRGAGFLLSDEEFFPTWWTLLPVHSPLITGWSAGPHADGLLNAPRSEIISRALHDLARITGVSAEESGRLLESAYFHDWHADPFARGAYSYVPVGALDARETLARPIADTLYFAGEAAETSGHSATVHGAIASGRRAARQILESR
jgi:monoamine oxidase